LSNYCVIGVVGWLATIRANFQPNVLVNMFADHNTTHSLIEPQHQPRNSALGASMPTHQRFAATCQTTIKPTAIVIARTRLPRFVII